MWKSAHSRSIFAVCCVALLIFGCSRPGPPEPVAPPPEGLDAETARGALLQCVRQHRASFGPFGTTEWEKHLRVAAAESAGVEGVIQIGAYRIDLSGKRYRVSVHGTGDRGERRHSDSWEGKFVRDPSGAWVAEPPREVHTYYGPKE
jgi:hypothetical protein